MTATATIIGMLLASASTVTLDESGAPDGHDGPDAADAHVSVSDMVQRARNQFTMGLETADDDVVARRHFARSTSAYRALVRTTNAPAEWYSGGSRSAYLAGDIAEAVAFCRDGLARYPDHRGLRRLLDDLRERVAVPRGAIEPLTVRPSDPNATWLSLPRWAVWSILAVFYLVGWRMLQRGGSFRDRRSMILGLLMILGVTSAGVTFARQFDQAKATWDLSTVVITQETDLRIGNNDQYPRRLEGTLQPGTELTRIRDRGGWIQVRLCDGSTGWIPESAARRCGAVRPES